MKSRFRIKDDQRHSHPANTVLRRMSSYAHGRSAITTLAPSVAPLIHSVPRRYFCSSSLTSFERSRRNLGLYSPQSRQIVLRQLENHLSSERRLVSWSTDGGFAKSPLLGINYNTPNVPATSNSKWPRTPAISIIHRRLQDGGGRRGGFLFRTIGRRCKSSSSENHGDEEFKNDAAGNDAIKSSLATPKPITKAAMTSKHIMGRLPNIGQIHRPTKEELLAAATGFWARLKIRFKWFSIRSARPFNIDEIGAFFSWILVGHVLWIILGTTTFFSLAIFAVNTVFAQGKPSLLLPVVLYSRFFRDISSLGRELPNEIFGGSSCFRVSHSAQMG